MVEPIIRQCRQCGKSFAPDPSNIKRGWGWHCSHKCANTSKQSREARLWHAVNKTDTCWLWTGAKRSNGYGAMNISGRNVAVHRLSWELHYGPVPDGLFVCHRCDVPTCVRPDHLFLGTHGDNMADARQKKRFNGFRGAGEQHPRVILTANQVAIIRTRYAQRNISQDELAATYRVSQMTISRIVRGVRWTHV